MPTQILSILLSLITLQACNTNTANEKVLVSSDTITLPVRDNRPKEIEINIPTDEVVLLNGIETPMDSIAVRMSKIVETFSEIEKEQYIVNISAEEHVKMGVIVDLKEQLNNINALRISYNKTK